MRPQQAGDLQLQQYRPARSARVRLPLGGRTARTMVTETPGASQDLDVVTTRSATRI